MWFEGEEIVVTTTLYPIEKSEGVALNVDLDSAWMFEINNDSFTVSQGFEDAFITEILLTGPTEEDDYTVSQGFEDAVLVVILLTGETPEDDYTVSQGFEDALLQDILITAYSPDHGWEFAVDVDILNCSMSDA